MEKSDLKSSSTARYLRSLMDTIQKMVSPTDSLVGGCVSAGPDSGEGVGGGKTHSLQLLGDYGSGSVASLGRLQRLNHGAVFLIGNIAAVVAYIKKWRTLYVTSSHDVCSCTRGCHLVRVVGGLSSGKVRSLEEVCSCCFAQLASKPGASYHVVSSSPMVEDVHKVFGLPLVSLFIT